MNTLMHVSVSHIEFMLNRVNIKINVFIFIHIIHCLEIPRKSYTVLRIEDMGTE